MLYNIFMKCKNLKKQKMTIQVEGLMFKCLSLQKFDFLHVK